MNSKNDRPPKETWIATKLELARLLGVSRPTLDTYTTLPGFPKRTKAGLFPLEQCRAFCDAQLNRNEEAHALRLQKLKNEVAMEEIELLDKAGKLMPVEWTELTFAHLAVSIRNIIQGSDLSDEQKKELTEKAVALDASEFIAQLRSQAGSGSEGDHEKYNSFPTGK